MISIIVVSYNEKEYLRRCIESCISQSYNDIEIIVGDDGSDDGSIEELRNIGSELGGVLRYFVNDRPEDTSNIIPSIRVSNTIKKALSLSKGEYIQIISADDYFCDNDKFKKAIGYLDENPSYVAYATGYKNSDDSKEHCFLEKSRALYWSGDYIHISCFIFRRAVEDYLLDRICDDSGLVYSLACYGKWYISNDISFVYFQRPGSIMHKADLNILHLLEIILYQDILNYKKGNTRLLIASYSRFYYAYKQLAKNYLDLKDNDIYQRYISCSAEKNNDMISKIIEYEKNRTYVFFEISKMCVVNHLLKIFRKREV
ncbi:MAG: glycosyltransferase family 2 protein [Lachnospiraceae bacterium]|nr:glycosyltransferase family 2 protein [Lachnospiraceae bacterium]